MPRISGVTLPDNKKVTIGLTTLYGVGQANVWEILDKAYHKNLRSVFFIDHWMGKEIMDDTDFHLLNTILVSINYHQKNMTPVEETKHIKIYQSSNPQKFFSKQSQKELTDHTFNKNQALASVGAELKC